MAGAQLLERQSPRKICRPSPARSFKLAQACLQYRSFDVYLINGQSTST